MLPESKRNELEGRDDERLRDHRLLRLALFFTSLTVGLTVAGPLLHELSHISVLQLFDCGHTLELVGQFQGLRGEVKPTCPISGPPLVFFYSAGFLVVSATGLGLGLASSSLHRRMEKTPMMTGGLGLGMVASLMFSLGPSGDVARLLQAAGMSSILRLPLILLIFAFGSAASLWIMRTLLAESEGQEG